MRRCRHLLLALSLTAAIGPSLIAQPAPPRLRLVEDYRLDATKEDFPTVGSIWVGPKSQLVVPIRQDMQLRIYDAAGKRIAVTGRSGSGPGEFRSMGPGGWKADTIWVSDGTLRRVTYLTPNGKLIRSTAWPSLEGVQINGPASVPPSSIMRAFAFPAAEFPDGSMLLHVMRDGDGSAMQAAFGGPPLVLRLATDRTARILHQLPSGGDERWGMAVAGMGRPVPFAAMPMIATSSTGSHLAHMTSEATSARGGTFTVSLFRSNGDTVYVRTFPFTGVPVSAASRDSALAALLPVSGRPTEGPSELPQRFQEIARKRMPPVHAGVTSLQVGTDASVWVALRETAEGTPVMVLDERGSAIGSILVPKGSRLRRANRTHVWLTETDDDGLVSVVRYRLIGDHSVESGARNARG